MVSTFLNWLETCHDNSWYVMTYRERGNGVVTKNHQMSSNVTKYHHMSFWPLKELWLQKKSNTTHSTCILQSLLVAIGLFHWKPEILALNKISFSTFLLDVIIYGDILLYQSNVAIASVNWFDIRYHQTPRIPHASYRASFCSSNRLITLKSSEILALIL